MKHKIIKQIRQKVLVLLGLFWVGCLIWGGLFRGCIICLLFIVAPVR